MEKLLRVQHRRILTRHEQTHLCQCVLLLGGHYSIAEEESIVLELNVSD